jgi:hypothetical protein
LKEAIHVLLKESIKFPWLKMTHTSETIAVEPIAVVGGENDFVGAEKIKREREGGRPRSS